MHRDPIPDVMYSIEESLVASILYCPEAIDDLLDNLYPTHFANRNLANIYDAMRALAGRGVAISPTSTATELRARGHLKSQEDEQYVHELWGSSGSAANVTWCADQIRSAWRRRDAVAAASEFITALQADGADLASPMDRLQSRLDNATKASTPAGPRPMGIDIVSAVAEAKLAAQSETSSRGVSTGFPRLDWWTSGLQKTNLVILAAETGKGKTSLGMNIAVNVARQGDGVVVIFSMEMGRSELACRVAASETGVDLRKLIDGSLDERDLRYLEDAQRQLAAIGGNILLDVSGRVTPTTIRAHLRRIARRHKIALVVVDYLQLCGTAEKAESQYVRTSMISGDLKAVAVDFDVPVLALSQLSREAARRGGEPRLSDLRDSGTIEQDANVVVFIHRASRDQDAADVATVIVAKNRNGPTGKFNMHWNARSVRFDEITDREPPARSA
ncbi:MAG: AAA family ATPase [bacterium]|nr:AAA family ATPase [bacterium]